MEGNGSAIADKAVADKGSALEDNAMPTKGQQSYLFVTWEGGGNVPPVLGLAASLIQRGHRVRVLAEPCLADQIQTIGAEYIAFQKHFIREDRALDLIQDWRAKPLQVPAIDNILVAPAYDVAKETIAAIEREQTDIVVADFMMPGALFAAEYKGIKRVALFHMPEYLPGEGRPPGGMGLLPAEGSLGELRDRILAKVFYQVMKQYRDPLNQVRKAYQLPAYESLVDAFHQADLRLIQTSEAFDAPIKPAPKNVRYVGPVLDDPAWTGALEFNRDPDDPRPLVVVSLSSTFQNQKVVLERIIKACGKVAAQCVVTLGPAMKNEHFEAPKNVILMDSAPHNQLFPMASAVITHAGHGTVMRALSHGLPLLSLPMGRDQLDNAALVAHHGAGLKLKKHASTKKITQALERLLKERSFTEKAAHLQQHILADAKENRAVSLLEGLLST